LSYFRLREHRLHAAPDQPVIPQSRIEHDSRQAATSAVDAHPVPVHQVYLAGRPRAVMMECDCIEPTAGCKNNGDQSDA